MAFLSTVGTPAMLWVGGSILTHGLDVLGWPALYDTIHHWVEAVLHGMSGKLAGFAGWAVTALADGKCQFALLLLIPLVTRLVAPAWLALTAPRG
ncbi:MAG: DUF808 family protein [Paracoccaceae bacterium]